MKSIWNLDKIHFNTVNTVFPIIQKIKAYIKKKHFFDF